MSLENGCAPGPTPDAQQWIHDGGFIVVFVGIFVMFWGLSFVCEEYCVPSITVFCKRNRISDDVAGAIFIGTGLSLPVLFASFVGLFFSNSAIGVGTVVGGDIFNHLINVAVSIYSAPDKTLKLNPYTFTREAVFYAISCIAVVWASKGNLRESFQGMLNKEEWLSCLSIDWFESLILVICYFLYALIDAYYSVWMNLLQRCYVMYIKAYVGRLGYIQPSRISDRGSIDGDPEGHRDSEDSGNDHSDNNNRYTADDAAYSDPQEVSIELSSHFAAPPVHDVSTLIQVFSEDSPSSPDLDSHITQLPLPVIDYRAVQQVDANVDLSNFTMYVRSSFFTVHAVGCIPSSRAWKLRYFTLDSMGLYYRLDARQPQRGSHVRFIDVFDLEEVRVTNHDLLEFCIRLRTQRKSYYFRGSDTMTFEAVVSVLTNFLFAIKKRNESELLAMALKSRVEVSGGQEDALADPDNESVGETFFVVPVDWMSKISYFLTLPLKAAIYWTVPDVRRVGREGAALQSIGMCVVWLALMTYALIEGLSEIANLLKINSSVMGLTMGAWAASYPALWSSVVVARSGFGDMAMCNALGSNIFSNFIGLGLPWLFYAIIYRRPYAVLEDEGVVLSLSVLLMVLLVTYVVIAASGWTLRAWMVPLFSAVYLAFIVYFIYFAVTL